MKRLCFLGLVILIFTLISTAHALKVSDEPVFTFGGGMTGVRYSPDGKYLAVAFTNRIELLDVTSFERVKMLEERADYISFNPTGDILAFVTEGVVKLWYLDSEKTTTLRSGGSWISALAFSDKSNIVAMGTDHDDIELWDISAEGDIKHTQMEVSGGIYALAVHPDGTLLAYSVEPDRENIHLWDVTSQKETKVLKGHTDRVVSLAFSPDGTKLASGAWGSDDNAKLWDVETGEEISTLINTTGYATKSVAFSPDGRFLAAGIDNGTVKLWNLETFRVKTLTGDLVEDTVNNVSFSPDGRTLAFGSQTAVVIWDIDAAITMWTPPEGRKLDSVRGLGSVKSIAFSPDGKRLASGQWNDAFIRLWDINTGEQVKNFGEVGRHVRSIAISPDGKFLAVGSNNSHWVPIFDMETGKQIRELQHGNSIGSVTFSPEGKILASAGVYTPFAIKLWDIDTGQEMKTLSGNGAVRSIAFSPDGKMLASAGDSGLIIWDLEGDRKSTIAQGGFNSVAFSPDGKLLAASDGSSIRMWEAGWELIPLQHTSVATIAFSPDGTLLASGSSEGTIKLCQITRTGENGNQLPTVQLTSRFDGWQSGALNLTAEANDQDGKVELVSFQYSTEGNLWQSIGEDKSAPYEVVWDTAKLLPIGAESVWLRVVARDNSGGMAIASSSESFGIANVGTPSGGMRAFTLSLDPGLHIISLPLKPEESLTARSFAEKLGATMIIEYDESDQTFSPFLPDIALNEGFSIRGGYGYIVNLKSPKDVTFAGKAWTNAAPSSYSSQSDWAFVVGGIVDFSPHRDYPEPLTVRVTNLRTGESSTSIVGSAGAGRYTTAFVDLTKTDVVQGNDQFQVTVKDATGTTVAGPIQREVRKQDIRNAFLLVNPRFGDVIPAVTRLGQNYPNPFNPETWIPFQLAEQAEVSITIYDVIGSLVRKFELGNLSAGSYISKDQAVHWDGKNDAGEKVSSGVYFYQLNAGVLTAVRKMVVMK